MRISDWSSDVCSSDLSAGGLGAGFGAALGVSSSLGLTGDGRDCSPSRCALPMTALRLTPPSASAIWLAVIPFSHIALSVSLRSSVQAMSALQNPLPGCGRRRQRLRDRSEEHTSELQSLMRTSSAGFCMKKKQTLQLHPSQTPCSEN